MRKRFPAVLELDDGRLATPNLVPGVRVGEEALVRLRGGEHRVWDPTHSKLAAYILKGAKGFPVRPGDHVVYLGAGNGTTVSHVSDIVGPKGRVVAVEFSPRPFRDLLEVARSRSNVLPVLADAWQPDRYRHLSAKTDVVVQDVAQRDQAAFLIRNLRVLQPAAALLSIKARSVDVAREPKDVYRETVATVKAEGWRLEELVELDPHEKDHAVARFSGPPGKRPRAARAKRR